MKKITKIFASVFALVLVCVGAIGLVGCKNKEDNIRQQRINHVVKLMDDLKSQSININSFVEGSSIIPIQSSDSVFSDYAVTSPDDYVVRDNYIEDYQMDFVDFANRIKIIASWENFEFDKWFSLENGGDNFYKIVYSNEMITHTYKDEDSCVVYNIHYKNNSVVKVEMNHFSIYEEEGPVDELLYMQIWLSTDDSRMIDSYVMVNRCDYSSGNNGYEIDLYSELSGQRYQQQTETNANVQTRINIKINFMELEIEKYKNQSTTNAIEIPENVWNV